MDRSVVDLKLSELLCVGFVGCSTKMKHLGGRCKLANLLVINTVMVVAVVID